MTRYISLVLVGHFALACDPADGSSRFGGATLAPAGSTTATGDRSSGPDATSTGDQQSDTTTGDATTGDTTTGDATTGDSGTADASTADSSTGPGCTPLQWFPDADGDGFGADDAVVMTCDAPSDHVAGGGDCDDQDDSVNIAATEVCDQIDNDCDGLVDEGSDGCGSCSLFDVDTATYAVCTDAAVWSEAQAQCEADFGGSLVVIESPAENAALAALLTAEISTAWIGLSDIQTEGSFGWVNGSPLGFTGWNTGEPNDAGGNEDCVEFARATGVWNDLHCSAQLPYVCLVPQ